MASISDSLQHMSWMFEAFRDPLWQFLGVVFSFCALVVAFKTLPFQLRRKSLTFSYYAYPLLSYGAEDLRNQIRVLYRDKDVANLNALNIEFANDGFVEINAADFDQPLSIHLDKTFKFLSATVAGASPDDLPVQLEVETDKGVVKVRPLLLNRGDWFRLSILIDSTEQSDAWKRPKVSARIQGISSIKGKPYTSGAVPSVVLRWLGLTIILAASSAIAALLYDIGRRFAGF